MAERRPLEPGRQFQARYRKQEYFADVGEDGLITVFGTVPGEPGTVQEEVDGEPVVGSGYKSLSKAGTAITGYPTNGWAFWHDYSPDAIAETPADEPVADEPFAKDDEAEAEAEAEVAPPKPKASKPKASKPKAKKAKPKK